MAIAIEKSVDMPAAPEKVWTTATDLSRWGEWLVMHRSWKSDVPDQLAPGSTMVGVASVLNMPNTITWTVEETSGSALSISGTGMAGAKVRIRLAVEPAGGGTLLTVATEFEGQMIVGAIAGAIERAAKVDIDRSLANLAGLVA